MDFQNFVVGLDDSVALQILERRIADIRKKKKKIRVLQFSSLLD